MRKYIFGAKATAAGLYKAISVLEPEKRIEAFLVSSMESNPQEIWGHPVRLLQEVSQELSEEQKMKAQIYVAVPELIHEEIENLLRENGFSNLELIDSRKEADIMERYYRWMGAFASVHDLPLYDEENAGYQKDLKALSSDEKDRQMPVRVSFKITGADSICGSILQGQALEESATISVLCEEALSGL